MDKTMTRMPDGSFSVDGTQLTISREAKAPYIPSIKLNRMPNKIADYLYYIKYSDWDYAFAKKYFRDRFIPRRGACSAVRNGDMYGRNYDWNYDECSEFIVQTEATKGRHASIGVAASVKSLTEAVVSAGQYSDGYDILPFMVVDGINDAGVVCNVNILPHGDKPVTTGSNPAGDDLPMIMIPRYILDYASTADEAVELLSNANVIAPNSDVLSAEMHFMIADHNKTYVVEFVNNEISVIEDFIDDKPIMTNFYLTGFDGNTATAYYKSAQYDAATTTLTKHAMGVERFDILSSNYTDGTTKDGMIGLMDKVRYTRAYDKDESPFWYSEFSADNGRFGDQTIDSTAQEFEPVVDYCIWLYERGERDGSLWQTVHCAVYDMPNKILYVNPQETGEIYEFRLNVLGQNNMTLEQDIPALTQLVLKSSTAGSSKRFAVTVNDNGEISATEIV